MNFNKVYRKRLVNWLLVVTLIVLINNGCNNSAHVTVIKKITLDNFPSASSIEYYNNKFYVIGDDAKLIIVLNKDYKQIDSITLFKAEGKRIPKQEKQDLEASAIFKDGNETKMLVFGSASLPQRERAVALTLQPEGNEVDYINTHLLAARIKSAGISEVNIEGAAAIKDRILLSNRANQSNRINQLIITGKHIVNEQETGKLIIAAINLPKQKKATGISGLTYVPEKDMLIFCASTEETYNAYTDGKIGDSYIGWINNITTKMDQQVLKPDGFINLSLSNSFKDEKIESVCVEKVDPEILTLHLVSDNDNGKSTIFKIHLRITH